MQKPIRLGLIGCGGIVQITHARAYRALTDTVQVTALADVVPENLQKVGETVRCAYRKPIHRLSRDAETRSS